MLTIPDLQKYMANHHVFNYLFVIIFSQKKLGFIKIKGYLVKYITICENSIYEIPLFLSYNGH